MRLTTQNNGDDGSEVGGKEPAMSRRGKHAKGDQSSQEKGSDDDGEEEEDKSDEAEDDEDEDEEVDEDEDEDEEDDDEDDGSSARESGRLMPGADALGTIVQQKVQIDKEMERLVTLKQTIVNEGSGKYT